jgi:hypothetical protein
VAKEDDDAWQAIVDNYGDRPQLDDDPFDEPAEEPAPLRRTRDEAGDVSDLGDVSGGDDLDPDPTPSWDDPYPDSDWESDRFVPPPPPPLPRTTPDRTAAWAGVFGAPLVLLVCLLFRIDLPELVAYSLVAAFVGGFLYLVLTMTREPRDPDDDGAVL